MMVLSLAWTLLTLSLWTSGSSQILQQEAVIVRYPKILGTETIDCDCTIGCDSVYWYRSINSGSTLQFLGRCNTAGRFHHGSNVEKTRFKILTKSSTSFRLQILNLTEEDAGTYSCVLKGKIKDEEEWKSGILLQPGVIPPTVPPKIKCKAPANSVCHCSEKAPLDGCGYLVLWPLAGLISALALALIGTTYYFSRLPKKCRHYFVKKRVT